MNDPAVPSFSSPTSNRYHTRNLGLAVFILTTGSLEFAGIETTSKRGPVDFCFHDPDEKGRALERAYETGAQVTARDYHANLKWIRREMDAVRGGQA